MKNVKPNLIGKRTETEIVMEGKEMTPERKLEMAKIKDASGDLQVAGSPVMNLSQEIISFSGKDQKTVPPSPILYCHPGRLLKEPGRSDNPEPIEPSSEIQSRGLEQGGVRRKTAKLAEMSFIQHNLGHRHSIP